MTSSTTGSTRRKGRVRGNLRACAPAARRGSRCSARRKHIYAQVIDDEQGATLAAASSLEKALREGLKTGASIDAAKAVGKLDRRARQGRRASRPWCSTAAAISFTAGSRPWPTPPARAA